MILRARAGDCLLLLAMLLSACSGGPLVESETASASALGSPGDSVPCGGVSDCRTFSNKPVCADGLSAICSVNGVCLYRLINSQDCRCMAGEMQACNLGNGHQGVSTCVAGAPTATGSQTSFWGDCSALP